MAEKIVSPGVFTRENDLSFLQTGVAAIGTAFVGPFKEGPLVPTVVNTQSEFEQLYGTVDDTYYTPLAVVAYLKEAGQAVIARVSGYGGYTQLAPQAIKAGGSIIGILFSTTASGETPGATFTHNTGSFSATVGGESLTGISLYNTNPTNIGSVFGSDAQGGKKAYAYGYFPNKAAALSSSVLTTSDTTLGNQYFPTEACEAKTPYILSQDISGERYKLFRFETISGGTSANTKIKVALTNIKKAGSVPGTNYSTFTVVVRQLSDTNKRKIAIESFSNVNLDPNSVNYINRVIGDRKISYDATTGKVTETGDWINRSKYIRMVSPQADTNLESEKIPTQCAPFGHDAYYSIIAGASASVVPPVTFISASSTQYGGIDLDNKIDNLNYLKPIPTDTAGGTVLPTGSNQLFGLDTVDGGGLTLTSELDTEISKRNFIVAFQGGFDGQSPAIKNLKGDNENVINTQGFDCSTITASGSIAYLKQFAALSNSEEFDIQLMVTPGLNQKNHGALIKAGMTMIQDRADAFYVVDATPINGEITDAIESAKAYDTSYGAMYYPWVKTLDPITGKLVSIPATALIPGMYAANDRTAGEWFAPAGLNRGGLQSAVAVIRKCNQADRDNLYENKVNPIVIFANQGVVAFGQKTLQAKPSALDRINVRRLMLTIRKFVASTSRYLVFEQNDPKTRESFVNIVTPYLASIQHARGIYAFKVIMDESNNTPDLVDRGILKGSIYLQPSKVAEFIQIDFNILPTGATFGG